MRNVLKSMKANICAIGMVVGLLFVLSLFLLPLHEQW